MYTIHVKVKQADLDLCDLQNQYMAYHVRMIDLEEIHVHTPCAAQHTSSRRANTETHEQKGQVL
jgi:hypothetical protein